MAVEGCSEQALRGHILRWLHTRELGEDASTTELVEALEQAEEWQLEQLQVACNDVLQSWLAVNNVV